ncbi:hypothetical protein C5C24_08505 [Rathayibacter sp. AY2B3]|uniref:hypothetical protein n=1 Tax=Rathayibacter sp. AY2B3 TaxID=2080569 RepID=UPI000CE885FA|nr:hypothetical protein [Rathayibacter sp. AY2B3]PPG51013.1 hypothetical protein C5C24_08505 [Rathayibacter sp. AY2B3]
MTEDQIVALVWAPIAIVFGAVFIGRREWISARARDQMRRRGQRVGPRTQSPVVMAAGGALLVVVGVVVVILLTLTSVLRGPS